MLSLKNFPQDTKNRVVSADLELEIDANPKVIEALQAALALETKSSERCPMSLHRRRNQSRLRIIFNAQDIVSLRASFNTNFRLIAASVDSINAAKRSEH